MAAANRQPPLVESPHLADPGKQDRVNQGVPVVPAFDAYRGVAVLGIMVFHILGASGILLKAGDSPPAQLVWGSSERHRARVATGQCCPGRLAGREGRVRALCDEQAEMGSAF